jgi:hypothetical protein
MVIQICDHASQAAAGNLLFASVIAVTTIDVRQVCNFTMPKPFKGEASYNLIIIYTPKMYQNVEIKFVVSQS